MNGLTLFDKIFGGGLLAGKKAYLAALTIAITAAFGWFAGDIGAPELITQLGEAAAVAGLRAGISKSASQGG